MRETRTEAREEKDPPEESKMIEIKEERELKEEVMKEVVIEKKEEDKEEDEEQEIEMINLKESNKIY